LPPIVEPRGELPLPSPLLSPSFPFSLPARGPPRRLPAHALPTVTLRAALRRTLRAAPDGAPSGPDVRPTGAAVRPPMCAPPARPFGPRRGGTAPDAALWRGSTHPHARNPVLARATFKIQFEFSFKFSLIYVLRRATIHF
jgi:hypothetical protein